jgi:hypothetical protein
MERITWRSYYRRYFIQVGQQARADASGLVIGFVLAVAVQVLQVLYRVMYAENFRANFLSTFWPYAAAVVTYLIYAAIRAPLELDRGRAAEIVELERRLGDPVSVEFENITFEHATPDKRCSRLRLNLLIRTSDTRATLSGWGLRSESSPSLKPLLAHIWGLHRISGNTVVLEAHDHQPGAFLFDFVGPAQASEEQVRDAEHKWRFEFRDSHRPYSVEIPTRLYAPIHLSGTM